MPYENLIYNETVMLGILLAVLFLFFAVISIMLFISVRDSRKHIPLIRPVSEPAALAEVIESIIQTRGFYSTNTSFLLESRKAVPEMLSKKKAGLLYLGNNGNSAAIDLEIKTFGDYFVSDGPETKLTSIQAGGKHAYLFYLPEDMINDLMLYPVKIRFKNINGRTYTNRFHVALSPEPKLNIDLATELRIYLQM
ncbi:MAG: hypothetical protein R6W99_03930 [Clostridia bacterium]